MKIKIGGTRIVLILKKVVVKIPLPLTLKTFSVGIASNYNEAIKWQTESEENKNMLAPVLFHLCGLILVQQRLKTTNEMVLEDATYYNSLLFFKSVLFSEALNIPQKEITVNNIGIDDKGALKIIDYGLTLPSHNRGKFYDKYKSIRNKLN